MIHLSNKCTAKYLNLLYSEKATKFCKIFTLLLSYVVPVKSKMKILQNFVAFSEYMNLVWLLVRSAIRITPLWISRSSDCPTRGKGAYKWLNITFVVKCFLESSDWKMNAIRIQFRQKFSRKPGIAIIKHCLSLQYVKIKVDFWFVP